MRLLVAAAFVFGACHHDAPPPAEPAGTPPLPPASGTPIGYLIDDARELKLDDNQVTKLRDIDTGLAAQLEVIDAQTRAATAPADDSSATPAPTRRRSSRWRPSRRHGRRWHGRWRDAEWRRRLEWTPSQACRHGLRQPDRWLRRARTGSPTSDRPMSAMRCNARSRSSIPHSRTPRARCSPPTMSISTSARRRSSKVPAKAMATAIRRRSPRSV